MQTFFWKDGQMILVGTLGGLTSRAASINDADQIAGEADTAGGNRHALLWEKGKMTDLGTLGGDHSAAIGINNHGQITGLSTTAPGQALGDPGTHAFVWENGTMTDIGTLGGEFSRANGNNEAGQVTGGAELADGSTHPFIWQNGTMTDIGVPSGYRSARGIRISMSGTVCGFAFEPIGTPTTGAPTLHGFVYVDGQFIALGALGGPGSVGSGVNADGMVVGQADIAEASGDQPPPTHGFVWQDGTMTDINNLLVPGSGLEITSLLNINDAGQTVGLGMKDGVTHAILLNPAS
jgi:probable HAF family extracellular repeat protein